MGKKTVTLVLSALIIIGAAAYLFLHFYPIPPPINAAPHEGLGQAVARQAANLAAGGRVVLIARDTSMFLNPAADAQIRSFTRALKQAGLRIATTNLVKVDALRVVAVPPGDFFQILKKAGEGDVIVSFLGPPNLSDDQVAKLGGRLPKVVAVCTGDMPRQIDLKRLFNLKLLHAAIVSKRGIASSPPASKREQDWFDYLFAVVTPADLSEWQATEPGRR